VQSHWWGLGTKLPKTGVWWRSLTYFDYLTVDIVFNFARFIKGEKIMIMNSGGGGDRPYRHAPPWIRHWTHSAQQFFIFLLFFFILFRVVLPAFDCAMITLHCISRNGTVIVKELEPSSNTKFWVLSQL